MTDESDLKDWHEFLARTLVDRVTECGKFPHRANGTTLAMNLRTLDEIFELAEYGQKMKKSHGKKVKASVAAELRKMADSIEK